MARKSAGEDLLENAYRLATPADSIAYYRRFAATYDSDFVEALGYVYPKAVAAAYRARARADDVPIADIGCGTGAVAAALGLAPEAIDGFDISEAMLGVAAQKRLYRALHAVDLTASLDAMPRDYGAVVSSGTFTHGHLGPDALENLLAIARRGALFVIGVNETHFAEKRFGEALEAMTAAKLITPVTVNRVRTYAKAGHAHSDDHVLILDFRKL